MILALGEPSRAPVLPRTKAPDWQQAVGHIVAAAHALGKTDTAVQSAAFALLKQSASLASAAIAGDREALIDAATMADAMTARAQTGAQVDGPVVLPIADPQLHAQAPLFYAHCLAFAQFLETTAGPGALGRVTARLMRGEPVDVAVANEIGDVEVEQLERRWQHWGNRRRHSSARSGLANPPPVCETRHSVQE